MAQLSKEIGVRYSTAWMMQHEIRMRAMSAPMSRAHRDAGQEQGDRGGCRRAPRRRPARPAAGARFRRTSGPALRQRQEPGRLSGQQVRPGSHVRTDAWNGHRHVADNGFTHTKVDLSKQDQPPHKLFPLVHITLGNLKRFLLGTHHQVEGKHLGRYVAEFNYRLNRRSMEQDLMTRLLRATLAATTITYKQLIATAEING